jgi:hypothetical protein
MMMSFICFCRNKNYHPGVVLEGFPSYRATKAFDRQQTLQKKKVLYKVPLYGKFSKVIPSFVLEGFTEYQRVQYSALFFRTT